MLSFFFWQLYGIHSILFKILKSTKDDDRVLSQASGTEEMVTMKAAVVRQKDILVEDVPRPQASPGEVIIEVKYCGICGSDVHRFAAGGFPDGAILGHEPYGVVAEVGEGITEWQGGERVVVIAYDPCRQCRWCQQGEYQLCLNKHWIGLGTNPGAFAEYVKAYSTMLLRVPDQVGDQAAALTEPLAVALHAVRTAHINLGDTAVVIGAGPIGLLVTQCLHIQRPHPVQPPATVSLLRPDHLSQG